jgi:AcrR family transcriptional regulator
MIHHYFGSKEGLYDAIVDEFTSATFEVPLRLIAKPPKTQEEFILRLEMFISETFRALIAQAPVFRIIARESKKFVGTSQFHTGFATYLIAAQDAGFLSADLKIEMVTGIVLDRLGGQIMYVSRAPDDQPNVLNDEDYAEAWLSANTAVLIHGLARSD